MIDIFDLYNKFCADNNTFQGGFVRPERDFENIVNTISFETWNEWTAQAEKSQETNDNLRPFLISVNIIVTPSAGNYGIAAYPKDKDKEYARYSVARVLSHNDDCVCDFDKDTYQEGECKERETAEAKEARVEKYKDGITERLCVKVESSKWSSMLEHKTKCPTFENPGITQFDKGFKVAPRKVSVIVLDYYKKPVSGKFSYTIAAGNPQTGAGDYLVYDKNNSIPLEWPETMIPYFIDKLRESYARYTRDGGLFQMSKKP